MNHKVILVVEDDYIDIISIQRMLKKLNILHTLHIAHNGEDAIKLLQGHGVERINPDITLLDINMPKMNGLEFLDALKKDRTLNAGKVFVLTTSGEERDFQQAKLLGAVGYIIKPLDLDNYENKSSSMDNFNLLLELLK
jgi:CheY-like chemotaxis protein